MLLDKYPKQEKGFPASSYFATRSIFDWFADSGATSHMTDQRSLMTNYVPIAPGSRMVIGIGGSNLPVHGQGEVTVIMEGNDEEYTISPVLYVPDLGQNLFSIVAVTDAGMKAVFFDNKVNILDKDGRIYMEGDRAGNTMYHLKLRSRVNTEQAAVAAGQQSSTLLWHERLGHVCLRNIRRMFTKGLVDGLYLNDTEEDLKTKHQSCLGCAKGKMSRHSYPDSSQHQTSFIGERIHSDICGPMSHSSLGGARFIVTFKDEFSGRTGVYFMKNK